VTRKLKAFQLLAPSKGHVTDLPEPGQDHTNKLIVKMNTVSICGTDAEIFTGEIVTKKLPIIMGHEGGGIVEQAGSEAKGDLKEKSQVLVDPNIFDGTCVLCKRGLRNLCEHGGLMGRDQDGIFSERVALDPVNLYEIPNSIPAEVVPLIQPLSTVLRASNDLSFEPDDFVVVVGLGATGLMFARLCKLKGARVIASRRTWYEHMPPLARDFGVEFPIDSSKKDLVKEVKEITDGRGASTVILSAPAPELVSTSFEMLRAGGTVLQFFNLHARPTFDSWNLYMKELKIIGTRSSVPSDFHAAIELARSGLMPLEKLITQRLKFDDMLEAIRLNGNRKQNLKIVIKVS
jgi:L-iditol 2-dehydrogenase